MSTYRESKEAYKKNMKTEKKCKDYDEELIECNKDNNFIEIMKKGYLEMANLNLQLAIDDESELVDANYYETWLSGE